MPPVRVAKSEWHFSSDMLALSHTLAAQIRIVWLAVLCPFIGYYNVFKSCSGEGKNFVAVVAGLVTSNCMLFLLEVATILVSLRGTPLQVSKRSAANALLFLQGILWTVQVIFMVYGTVVVEHMLPGLGCWPVRSQGPVHQISRAVVYSTWVLMICLGLCVGVYHSAHSSKGRSGQEVWERRCKCLAAMFCCKREMVAQLEDRASPLETITAVISQQLKGVSLTTSDILAALILIAAAQRRARNQWISSSCKKTGTVNDSLAATTTTTETTKTSESASSGLTRPPGSGLSDKTINKPFWHLLDGNETMRRHNNSERSRQRSLAEHDLQDPTAAILSQAPKIQIMQRNSNPALTPLSRNQNQLPDANLPEDLNGYSQRVSSQSSFKVASARSGVSHAEEQRQSFSGRGQDDLFLQDGDHKRLNTRLQAEGVQGYESSSVRGHHASAGSIGTAEPLSSGASESGIISCQKAHTEDGQDHKGTASDPDLLPDPPGLESQMSGPERDLPEKLLAEPITASRSFETYSGNRDRVPRELLQEASHWRKYAAAAYYAKDAHESSMGMHVPGSLFVRYKIPCACHCKCCCCCGSRHTGRPAHQVKKLIWQKYKIPEDDLLHISSSNAIQSHLPYIIAVDRSREKERIVLSIRGTSSLADLITDIVVHPEAIDDWLPTGFKKENSKSGEMFAHAGMVGAATAILRDLDNLGILTTLIQEKPGRQLVVTGHSLGAGVAALVALKLVHRFPALQAWAFCPPGSLVSSSLLEAMQGFCTSIVCGTDVVPRASLQTISELIDRMVDCLASCKQHKLKVFVGYCRHVICGHRESPLEADTLFHAPKDISAEACTVLKKYYQGTAGKPKIRQMYPPGRIIFLRPTALLMEEPCLLGACHRSMLQSFSLSCLPCLRGSTSGLQIYAIPSSQLHRDGRPTFPASLFADGLECETASA